MKEAVEGEMGCQDIYRTDISIEVELHCDQHKNCRMMAFSLYSFVIY